jgi:hypothetical protein
VKNMKIDKSIRNAIKIGLVFSLLTFATIATAANYNVTVQWTIPSDYGITITYPLGNTQIDFAPTGKTFTNTSAVDQTATIACVNVTNAGNTALDIKFNLTGTAPTGMVNFSTSKTGTGNPKQYWWAAANWTTQQLVVNELAVAATEHFWCRSAGTDVAAGVASGKLYINTSAD